MKDLTYVIIILGGLVALCVALMRYDTEFKRPRRMKLNSFSRVNNTEDDVLPLVIKDVTVQAQHIANVEMDTQDVVSQSNIYHNIQESSMTNTKSADNACEECDVQNIVTAVILSAECPLAAHEITERIMERCESSTYPMTREAAYEMVEDTLTALQRVRACTCCNEKYYACPNMGIATLLRRGEV